MIEEIRKDRDKESPETWRRKLEGEINQLRAQILGGSDVVTDHRRNRSGRWRMRYQPESSGGKPWFKVTKTSGADDTVDVATGWVQNGPTVTEMGTATTSPLTTGTYYICVKLVYSTGALTYVTLTHATSLAATLTAAITDDNQYWVLARVTVNASNEVTTIEQMFDQAVIHDART